MATVGGKPSASWPVWLLTTAVTSSSAWARQQGRSSPQQNVAAPASFQQPLCPLHGLQLVSEPLLGAWLAFLSRSSSLSLLVSLPLHPSSATCSCHPCLSAFPLHSTPLPCSGLSWVVGSVRLKVIFCNFIFIPCNVIVTITTFNFILTDT